MLQVKSLDVHVGETHIIKNFSYTFESGKVYVIMGPNGSGKSTLAYALMNHPGYEYGPDTRILLEGEDITELEVDKRAAAGLFLSFQTPLSLAGVSVFQLMQMALGGRRDPLAIRRAITDTAKVLGISETLLSRSLNDGASGGEKKKLEVLQAAVLDCPVQIYDEVDTGVDVDALAAIGTFLNNRREGKTYIIITHYNRILQYVQPDEVLIVANGQLVTSADASLVDVIEKQGYGAIIAKHQQ